MYLGHACHIFNMPCAWARARARSCACNSLWLLCASTGLPCASKSVCLVQALCMTRVAPARPPVNPPCDQMLRAFQKFSICNSVRARARVRVLVLGLHACARACACVCLCLRARICTRARMRVCVCVGGRARASARARATCLFESTCLAQAKAFALYKHCV